MGRIRSKTVEPVLGTLLNFMGMRIVNTRGIKQANKHNLSRLSGILMASLCYNLKKYLNFIRQNPVANKSYKLVKEEQRFEKLNLNLTLNFHRSAKPTLLQI